MDTAETFRILHFNDVYDLQQGEKEPVGGVARFKTGLDQYRTPNTLVLFSGDAFSPSVLTNVYQGKQMIQPLNSFGIDVACFGNHDFDFPIEDVMELKRQTNFPWLLSNVYDKQTGNRMGDAEEYIIFEKGGLKIGVFGLAEKQWLDVLLTSYHGRCDYIDFVDVASRMVYTLREEHKCDFVIALTHMMGYNDTKLAEKVDGIDLILGGHDHLIRHEIHRTTQIVKSGTNFKNFSILRIEQTAAEANKKKCFNIHHQLEEVTRKFPSNPVLEPYVREMYDKFQQRQDQIICLTDCEIDLRFCFIRKNESPYISMFADWYRFFTEADCVILSSGNFRNDCIVHEGPLSYGTVTNQIEDKVVVKAVKGSQLLQALDNAVAMYPNLSGRFACFSNLEFTWDSKRQPFHRVISETVLIGGQPIDLHREYKLCTHHFHSDGGDGFSMLKECRYLLNPEDSIHNQELTVQILNPDHAKCLAYAASANPHNHRIVEFEGRKLVALSPSTTKRVTML